MKILMLMGRGVEGTGQTRTQIEIHEWLKKQGHQVTAVANSEKKWGRAKSQVHEMNIYDFSKYPYFDSEDYDHIIVCSVPSTKYSAAGCDNFTDILEQYAGRVTITYVQVDHLMPSIRRNYYTNSLYFRRFFDTLDHVVTHSKDNDFCKFMRDMDVDFKYQLHEMMFISCDFDYLERYIKDFNQKINNLCYFLGRSARWKGPYVLKDFHHNYLKQAGFTTILDGMEASIGYLDQMYSSLKPKVARSDVELHLTSNPDDYIKEMTNHEAMFFGPYIREEALRRASKAKFGMFFTYIGEKAKGPIENTLMELVGVGLVPIVRKELYDSAEFINGKLSYHFPSEIGFIVYDAQSPDKAVSAMKDLQASKKKYQAFQRRSHSFLKKNFNQDHVMNHFWSLIND